CTSFASTSSSLYSSICSGALPALPSFPTRRSSDLLRDEYVRRDESPYRRRAPHAQPGRGDHQRHIPAREHRRADDGNLLRIERGDRKSTRLNSSHVSISYAVFCLKKKINYT